MKRKPPEKGFVNWDEKSYRRLIDAPPEKLSSSFQIQHSLLLNMLGREHEDGCAALRQLINECHETPAKKKALRKRAFQLFRGLIEGNILRIIPRDERRGPAKVALNIELQDDFSLNQALGIYLLDAIPQLDIESPDYALNVLSLVEAILENPDVILRKQVDLLKGELIGQLKSEGVEFEKRMELLEEVEWPKPGKDFIYDTYNAFVAQRPWMKDANVRPKSIAREMFEHWQSFEDYVKTYGLERSEAVLLRHLSEVYKVLSQTVPPAAKTEDLIEAEAFFEDILRNVDSSLLDEWEKLRNPEYVPEEEKPVAERRAVAFTRNRPAFQRALRNAVFTLVKAFAEGNTAAILAQIEPADSDGTPWTRQRIEGLFDAFYATHERIRLDPEARAAKHTRISEESPRRWICEQTLVDPEELNDWSLKLASTSTAATSRPGWSCSSMDWPRFHDLFRRLAGLVPRELSPIRQRADSDGLFELPGKRGLVGVTAGQRDLGDRLRRAGQPLAGGVDADFHEVLAGGDVEERADALVELIDGESGHFRQGGQAQRLLRNGGGCDRAAADIAAKSPSCAPGAWRSREMPQMPATAAVFSGHGLLEGEAPAAAAAGVEMEFQMIADAGWPPRRISRSWAANASPSGGGNNSSAVRPMAWSLSASPQRAASVSFTAM